MFISHILGGTRQGLFFVRYLCPWMYVSRQQKCIYSFHLYNTTLPPVLVKRLLHSRI